MTGQRLKTAEAELTNVVDIPGYELRRRLGSGGMGTVYLATQTSLMRNVAVKFLHRLDDPSAVRRFQRESLLAASVSHPGIVSMIDAGVVDGVPWLVREFVDGVSLAEVLAERCLTPEEVCRLLTPIAEAVTHLHQAGILHRDIKPRNILIDSDGRPRLCDFGGAVGTGQDSTLTQSDTVVGTLDYMAPEQRHRLDLDERADQYSLAAVAYEMLTGELPVGVFRRPSEGNPHLSRDVDSVLMRALSRDPDERFRNVASFQARLTRALRNDGGQRVRKLLPAVMLTAVASSMLTWLILSYQPPQGSSDVANGSPAAVEVQAVASAVDLPADPVTETTQPDLEQMTVHELRNLARSQGLTGYSRLTRSELIELIRAGGESLRLPPGWQSRVRIDSLGRRYRWYIAPDGKSYRRAPDVADIRSGDGVTVPPAAPPDEVSRGQESDSPPSEIYPDSASS